MNLRLIDLVRRYELGEIQLPLMQRDYVWTPKKLVSLLDSLYRGWPIGGFYVWQTTKPQVTKNPSGNLTTGEFYGYLLDGQQRLVSLSRAIRDPADGQADYCAYFDVMNESFVTATKNKTIQKRIANRDPTLISLSEIIRPSNSNQTSHLIHISNLIESISDHWHGAIGKTTIEQFRARLTRVSTMLDVAVPCEEFKDDHVSNAIELFARLNRGGTKLSAGDVEAAKLSQEATSDVLPLMRQFVREGRMRDLGLDFLFVLRALITFHRDNSSFASLPDKWATSSSQNLMESWSYVKDGIIRVVDIITEELGWTTRRWLPSGNALIPVVYYLCYHPKKLTIADRKSLCRFLLRAGVRSLFSGAVESSINKYVNKVKQAKINGKLSSHTLVSGIPKNCCQPIQWDQVRFETGMYSPLMQVYLAYLVSRQATSWVSQRPLIEVARGGVGDPLSVHHIFPKEYLQKHSIDIDRINCMANYAILAQSDNAALSDKDPRDAYNNMSQEQRKQAAEQLFIHANDGFFIIEEYDEFLDFRSKEIAKRLNAFLGFS